MDCACVDGIPGSGFNPATGLSWFNILFNVTESETFITDPVASHKISASCFHRIARPKRAATNHLLWNHKKTGQNKFSLKKNMPAT